MLRHILFPVIPNEGVMCASFGGANEAGAVLKESNEWDF